MKVQQIWKIWVILAMVACIHVACNDAASPGAGSSATLTLPPCEGSATYNESIIWESISGKFLSIMF